MASKRAISVERYENMGEAALVQKIMTREALVALLEDLARLDERRSPPPRRYTLLLGLCQLRRVTVDVLNGIFSWRASLCGNEVFRYDGHNYLVKVCTDCDFLRFVTPNYFGFTFGGSNPFALPIHFKLHERVVLEDRADEAPLLAALCDLSEAHVQRIAELAEVIKAEELRVVGPSHPQVELRGKWAFDKWLLAPARVAHTFDVLVLPSKPLVPARALVKKVPLGRPITAAEGADAQAHTTAKPVPRPAAAEGTPATWLDAERADDEHARRDARAGDVLGHARRAPPARARDDGRPPRDDRGGPARRAPAGGAAQWIDPPELTSSWHGEHVQVGERVRFRPAARPGTCMGMSMDTRALQKGLAESGRRPGTSTGALRPQGARGTRGRE